MDLPVVGILYSVDVLDGQNLYVVKTLNGLKHYLTTRTFNLQVGDMVELTWYSNLYMDYIDGLIKIGG